MGATGESFEHAVVERSADVPVVVDFWAEWCGPCHMLTPVLEAAVADREGAVELVKVNVDEEKELAARYGIRGIPNLKAFRNGRVVKELVGAQPRAVVDAFLDELTAPPLVETLREREDLAPVVAALDQRDYERAFELLLERITSSADGERDELRQLMVALFAELGHDDELVTRYRRRLATALY